MFLDAALTYSLMHQRSVPQLFWTGPPSLVPERRQHKTEMIAQNSRFAKGFVRAC